MTVKADQERRGAEQWFRRRGLPAVVRGRSGHLVVRTLPAVVGLTLFDLMYALLEYMDGDAQFGARLENTTFFVLYSSVLLGLVVLPPVGVWLAVRKTRRWVLHGAGFLASILLTACYVVVEPAVEYQLQNSSLPLGVAGNLATVGMLYVLTATGIGSVFGWALRAALRQMRGVGTMATRSLPLLLLVTTFGFFTTEIWQTVGTLRNYRIWLVVGFFGVIGILFLFSVLSAELQTVTALSQSTQPARPPHDYPFHGPADSAREPIDPGPPLTRAERANMVLMLLLTQAIQAMVFGILVFVLFAVLGWLAVPRKVMAAWTGQALASGTLFDVQVPIENELLQVCMLIAAFSALYFIVTVVTDTVHRSTFLEPVLGHLRVSLAARAAYLTRFAARPAEVSRP